MNKLFLFILVTLCLSYSAIKADAASPNDFSQRIAESERIVARDPKNIKAWISLGNDYFDTEQTQKGINAYGKALEIDPNNPNVLTDQGVLYRKFKQYDKALRNFKRANKIDPNFLQSIFNTGIVYSVDLKDREKARPYFDKILEIAPNSEIAKQVRIEMKKPIWTGKIEQSAKAESSASVAKPNCKGTPADLKIITNVLKHTEGIAVSKVSCLNVIGNYARADFTNNIDGGAAYLLKSKNNGWRLIEAGTGIFPEDLLQDGWPKDVVKKLTNY
jgi:tetratricopeptide (TPR) repeat protein